MSAPQRSVLAVIPARGGSKGLLRKNILPLAGKPLIGWTIEAALKAACVRRTVVSTDDEEIAEIARMEGAEVPFLRPANLATDTATSADVLRHAIEQCPGFDTVMLLQPTSPSRTSRDIDSAFTILCETNAPSCVSLCPVQESPWLMFQLCGNGRIDRLLPRRQEGERRQDLPSVYRLNGAIYLSRTEAFLSTGQFIGPDTVGYPMPAERSIDIDTREDFDLADRLLRKNCAGRVTDTEGATQ